MSCFDRTTTVKGLSGGYPVFTPGHPGFPGLSALGGIWSTPPPPAIPALAPGPPAPPAGPFKLALCYAEEDFKHRLHFDVQGRILQRLERIIRWDATMISPGARWDAEIRRQFREADIIVILVSDYLLASDYIMTVELPLALRRHHQGKAQVIPVILRDSHWEKTRLKELHSLPDRARPIERWGRPLSAWYNVGDALSRLLRRQP